MLSEFGFINKNLIINRFNNVFLPIFFKNSFKNDLYVLFLLIMDLNKDIKIYN